MRQGKVLDAPLSWTHGLFLAFGAGQIAAGIIMFFAYNWRDLPDLAKIALPQGAMALAFLVFAIAPRCAAVGQAAGAIAIILIGVSMAVVGQVYQLGADPWRLFAVWAAFALPLAILARSDAYGAIAFVLASGAFTLWAEQVGVAEYGLERRAIPASYAVLAALALLIRDFAAAPMAGPAPRWQRWFFAGCALAAAVAAGVGEVVGRLSTPYGSAALFAVAGAFYTAYRVPRPDRPTRSLALFALAVWFGALGLRLLLQGGADAPFGWTGMLLLAAVWVVVVTSVLARLLRIDAAVAPDRDGRP